MTDKQQALRDLLATIEADNFDRWSTANSPFTSPQKAFVRQAFNGSLDAAKALHDSVFPGMNQYCLSTDPTVGKASVCWWPNGLSEDEQFYGQSWYEENPARAWLVAIIKALIASEGGE